jgi:hypothetical protein
VIRGWCRICGHRIRYVTDRYAWRHEQPGSDHGPIPTTKRPEGVLQ